MNDIFVFMMKKVRKNGEKEITPRRLPECLPPVVLFFCVICCPWFLLIGCLQRAQALQIFQKT